MCIKTCISRNTYMKIFYFILSQEYIFRALIQLTLIAQLTLIVN